MSLEIDATLSPLGNKAFDVDHANGFVIGQNNDVLIKLQFYASNATTPYTLVCEFDMNLVANINATIQSATNAATGSPTIMAYANVTSI
jgi:hypothetical protein